MHNLIISVRLALASSSDMQNAIQMQKYMKSAMPYRGVNAPAQRKIYTEALKKYPVLSFVQYLEIISELWNNAEYREERYAAFYIADRYKKYQTMEAVPLYRSMIISGAWWDLVDGIATHLMGKLLEKYPQEMKTILCGWIDDNNLWIRRTAILSQNRLKDKTDWEMLKSFCEKSLHEQTFWIRKAIGWALREYSKTNPRAVRDFVEQYSPQMSSVSLKEALKYI